MFDIASYHYNNSTTAGDHDCWKKGFDLEQFVPRYQPPLQAAVFLLYFCLGVPLNAVIVFLVLKVKNLHQRDFAMTLQVIAADSLLVLCLPFAVNSLLGNSHLLGPAECYVMGFVKLFVNFIRFMMMLVLSLDRFCCVFFPFAYAMYGTKVCACLSLAVWTLAGGAASIPLGIDCYGYQPNFGFCMIQPYCSVRCRSFTLGVVCVMIAFGGIVPTVLYSLMFLKARSLAKRTTAISPVVSGHGSRPHVTFLWLFVTLLGCSVPLAVVVVTFPALYPAHKTAFWTFFGMSMTAFEAIVVADPIMLMRNRDLKAAAGTVAMRLKDFYLRKIDSSWKQTRGKPSA
eukprot:Em0007g741a